VDLRELVLGEKLLVIKARETYASWVILSSVTFHVVETAIIVVNVGVSPRAIWLVYNTSIAHHILPVLVFRIAYSRLKGRDWHVSIISGVGKHCY